MTAQLQSGQYGCCYLPPALAPLFPCCKKLLCCKSQQAGGDGHRRRLRGAGAAAEVRVRIPPHTRPWVVRVSCKSTQCRSVFFVFFQLKLRCCPMQTDSSHPAAVRTTVTRCRAMVRISRSPSATCPPQRHVAGGRQREGRPRHVQPPARMPRAPQRHVVRAHAAAAGPRPAAAVDCLLKAQSGAGVCLLGAPPAAAASERRAALHLPPRERQREPQLPARQRLAVQPGPLARAHIKREGDERLLCS